MKGLRLQPAQQAFFTGKHDYSKYVTDEGEWKVEGRRREEQQATSGVALRGLTDAFGS